MKWYDQQLFQHPISLSLPVGRQRDPDNTELELGDTLSEQPGQLTHAMVSQGRDILDAAMSALLTKREEYVLRQRYWTDRTLEDIGHDLGMTRERVRQIQEKAQKKLKARYHKFVEGRRWRD